MQTERREIAIPKGARVGPERRPMYGFETVRAECLKGLCVHKAIAGDPPGWLVAHEKSGLKIGPLTASTKARAVENMKAAAALNFDWTRDEDATLAALHQSRGIVDAVRAIGSRADA